MFARAKEQKVKSEYYKAKMFYYIERRISATALLRKTFNRRSLILK
jgi:hypothetical protein